jgi:hypothetical protein
LPGSHCRRIWSAGSERSGYRSVVNKTSLTHDEDALNLRDADEHYRKGYWVCLLVNENLLKAKKQDKGSFFPSHWIVMQSRIRLPGPNVEVDVFTWGKGKLRIPRGKPLALDDFLDHYHGFVAAKY